MINTSIVFDHRGRTKKGCEGPLEVRVTVDRKPYYIGTGVKVRKEEWKYDSVVNRVDSDELNERIAIIYKKVQREINACIEANRAVDVAEIRRQVVMSVNAIEESRCAFLEWCEEQVELLDVVEGTKKHYRTLTKRMSQYGKLGSWRDVSAESVLMFDAWLRDCGNNLEGCNVEFANRDFPYVRRKKISAAGIWTYHKCLKALLNRAMVMGKIERNPYEKLKGRFKRGEKESVEYLTEEEMMAICELKAKHGTILATARDLFVFQMYTGMAYSDAMRFDIGNYKKVKGKWVTRQQRVKSGVPFISQLLPPVVEVLERYDWQVPRLDQADYNHALKLIGEACGISVKMHSHLARHTFATYMLRNGVELVNLARMMGHTNTRQTERYAKVLALSVHEDFEKISKKLKKPKSAE